jgi:surface protein
MQAAQEESDPANDAFPFEQQPYALLPNDMTFVVLTYFDVGQLVKNKRICRTWRRLCTQAIDAKRTKATRRIFQTNGELRYAAIRYAGYEPDPNHYLDDDDESENDERAFICNRFGYCDPEDAEELACQYGWPIGKWDVSNVRDFSYLFYYLTHFNEDIGSWDVSNGTTLNCVFLGASSFNQDLSIWNASYVTETECMFSLATAFNQSLSSWDTSNVLTMDCMFMKASSFNQDLSMWDTSNVRNMDRMFSEAKVFSQDLSSWNVSNVTGMASLFCRASSFNGNLWTWNTTSVSDMHCMFNGCESFNKDISS